MAGGVAPGACGAFGGGDQGGGAVGEQGVGDHFLAVPAIVVMQAAELDGAQENAGTGVGLGVGVGGAEAIERAVAAHEADMGA